MTEQKRETKPSGSTLQVGLWHVLGRMKGRKVKTLAATGELPPCSSGASKAWMQTLPLTCHLRPPNLMLTSTPWCQNHTVVNLASVPCALAYFIFLTTQRQYMNWNKGKWLSPFKCSPQTYELNVYRWFLYLHRAKGIKSSKDGNIGKGDPKDTGNLPFHFRCWT